MKRNIGMIIAFGIIILGGISLYFIKNTDRAILVLCQENEHYKQRKRINSFAFVCSIAFHKQ
jgi:hypothetical protein